MPQADFFARFGFLHARGFFDEPTCHRLRAEIRMASGTPGTVHRAGAGEVDDGVRRVTWSRVSASARALVERQLTRIRTELERHFGVTLTRYEDPSFLRYGPGDFYLLHRDRSDDEADDPAFRARQVSVVAFLNGQGDTSEQETYTGGALAFAGLLDDPRLRRVGIPLVAEPGLLVAFPSDVLHTVMPVTHGERYTVVTWFS